MSMEKTKKTASKTAGLPAVAAAKTPAKAVVAKSPAKTPARAAAKAAPAKTPKSAAKKPVAKKPLPKTVAAQTSQEMMLARVESVRLSQRDEGYFDCFGRAASGYCDQGGCTYHAECMSVSRMIHSL